MQQAEVAAPGPVPPSDSGGAGDETKTEMGGTEKCQLIRKCDAEPFDVFTGRGHFAHPGNARFLRLVAERRADYVSARYSQKEEIAAEVVDLVYLGAEECDGGGPGTLQQPVRFLQIEMGDPKDPHSLWRVITGKEVMDKVKMKLRQKQRGGDKQTKADAADGDQSGQSGIVTFGVTSNNDGVKCDAEKSRTDVAKCEGRTATVSPCSAYSDCGSCSKGPLRHCGDVPPALSFSSSRPSSRSGGPQQCLLNVLHCARAVTKGLCSKYGRKSDLEMGATCTSNSDPDRNLAKDLYQLGENLYSMLTQTESTALAAATAEPMEPASKDSFRSSSDPHPSKRHGRAAVGGSASSRLPLTDFGHPTNLDIFVSLLLDSGSDSAENEFESIFEVDDTLETMIDFPEKYLFDLPPSSSTGILNIPAKIYGQDLQRAELMDAFQSVLIACEDARGLAVISGRAGSGKVRYCFTTCTIC